MREMVGGCCVCSDDRGWSENPLVYCDGQSCTVAVHQACYGIVTVPTGPWYCRKCESQERSVKVKCELCPSKYGALKRTDNSGWAHVVCALYIPEVRFGNVTTMEPIQLQLIPAERFNKVCYICEEKGKPANASVGACMQCNKAGCKQQFHVTCAQGLGLLCEEAGNYLDNVKYCGYCQHHYSKLKKGGNVKTIPPYKPVSTENHLSDSNSEKDTEGAQSGPSKSASPSAASKRRSGSSGKGASKASNPSSKTVTASQQKSVQNTSSSSKASEKPKVPTPSPRVPTKADEANDSSVSEKTDKRDPKTDVPDSEVLKSDSKDSTKFSKKRKANSRTPTPVSVPPPTTTEVAGVVTTSPPSTVTATLSSSVPAVVVDKKNTSVSDSDKSKKLKIDTTQSIIINQPVVALTSITSIKSTLLATTVADTANTDSIVSALPTQSIIQTAQSQSVNSLVVSVPLVNTSLSPHHPFISNQTSVLTAVQSVQERSTRSASAEKSTPVISVPAPVMTGGNSNPPGAANMLNSEMSNSGGLKITYEKQDALNTEVDMELEVSPTPPEEPSKRLRTQSSEKTERPSRNRKRNSANGLNPQLTSTHTSSSTKRSSRSQMSSPTPSAPGAFSSISQSKMSIKDSPPSSPDSRDASSSSRISRTKSRKSAPAAVNTTMSKDIKLFQNGVAAPHMLGNQLNPNSNMAQKMSDHLNSELEAHSIFNANDNSSNLVGPQLHHRVVASTRASSTGGSSTASGGSGLSSMLGGGGGNIPQTLDQLLERQWEQGSQFLMEQAQHFDIASLLSCLHQLRAENLRLEEHVSSLLQRRDHLLAVNARLAIPLTGPPNPQPAAHAHTVNNIHPAVGGNNHGEIPRPSRHSTGSMGYSHPQNNSAGVPVENGLPPEQYGIPHRSPASNQPSPTVRHSPAGPGYSNSGMLRQNADTSGRTAPRPHPYPLYQGPGPSQQQMVIRRDSDIHHQNSSKPS